MHAICLTPRCHVPASLFPEMTESVVGAHRPDEDADREDGGSGGLARGQLTQEGEAAERGGRLQVPLQLQLLHAGVKMWRKYPRGRQSAPPCFSKGSDIFIRRAENVSCITVPDCRELVRPVLQLQGGRRFLRAEPGLCSCERPVIRAGQFIGRRVPASCLHTRARYMSTHKSSFIQSCSRILDIFERVREG